MSEHNPNEQVTRSVPGANGRQQVFSTQEEALKSCPESEEVFSVRLANTNYWCCAKSSQAAQKALLAHLGWMASKEHKSGPSLPERFHVEQEGGVKGMTYKITDTNTGKSIKTIRVHLSAVKEAITTFLA